MSNRCAKRRMGWATLLCCPWAALAFMPPCGWANPVGENVVSGAATFDRSLANTLLVEQQTDKLITDWQDFSVNNGQTTQFIQPSATSMALNRVLGGNPSEIHGRLLANGTLYLINPNGVLVGASGVVQTGAFLASTLDVSNAQFLGEDELSFLGSSKAAVENRGQITALQGDVILIAHEVKNSGSIHAPEGVAALAAGSEVLVQRKSEERIFVRASSSEGRVENTGQIVAAAAELKAAGGNLYSLAINNEGLVRANGGAKINGRVLLTSNSGGIRNSGTLAARNRDNTGGFVNVQAGSRERSSTLTNSGRIEASGTRGGAVYLQGDRIELHNGTRIEVKGTQGGGQIFIGGGYQGRDQRLFNARQTIVAGDVKLEANATQAGAGGTVILWSDEVTAFYGQIEARGGAESGDGGFAEVSGKQVLAYRGKTDLTAPNGKTGTLLLDPTALVIQGGSGDGAADGASLFSGGAAGSVLYGNGLSTVYESEIEAQSLTADIILQAENSISVAGTFVGASLTLAANRNLTMTTRNNAGDGAGGINLTGSTDGNGLEFRTQGTGTITIIASTDGGSAGSLDISKLRTSGGNVTLTANGGGYLTMHNTISTSGGSLTVNTQGGTITALTALGTLDGAINMSTTGTGNITLNGALNASNGAVNLTALNLILNGVVGGSGAQTYTANTLALNGSLIGTGSLTLQPLTAGASIGLGTGGAGTFNLDTAEIAQIQDGYNTITIGHATGTGTVDVRNVTFNDPVTIRTPSGTISVQGPVVGLGNANITLTAANIALAGNITTTNQSLVIGNAATNVTVTGSSTLGTSGSGTISLLGTVNGPGNLTLNAGTSQVLLGSAAFGSSSALASLQITGSNFALGGVTTTGSQTYTGTVTLAGNLTSTTTGAITINGATILSGASRTITTAGGATDNITLNGAVSGTSALTTNAGSNGRVTFAAGAGTLSGLTVVANQLALDGDFFLSGGGDYNFAAVNSVFLIGTVRMYTDVAGGTSNAGNIIFGAASTINPLISTADFVMDVGADGGGAFGAITVGTIGDVTPVRILYVDGNSFTSTGAIRTSGFDANTITQDYRVNSIALGGNLSISNTGNGYINFRPRTDGTSFGIGSGSVGTLNLNNTELGYIQAGFSRVEFGSNTITSAIDSRAYAFNAPVRMMTTSGGTITVNGALSAATSGVSYTFTAGSITLNNNITATGGIAFAGNTNLGTNVTLTNTGSGDITLDNASSINGARDLFINNAVGNVTLLGALGNSTALSSFSLAGAATKSVVAVTTTGDQTYSGGTTTVQGNLTSTGGGNLTFNSPLVIDASNVVMQTSALVRLAGATTGTLNSSLTIIANQLQLGANLILNGGSFLVNNVATILLTSDVSIATDATGGFANAGAITMGANTTVDSSGGLRSLTLNATADNAGTRGTVTLGRLGQTTRLGAITASGGSLVLNGNISNDGGGAINFSGVTGITLNNNIVIDTDASGPTAGAVNWGSGSVNGNVAGRTLTIDASASTTRGAVTLGSLGDAFALGTVTITAQQTNLNGSIQSAALSVDTQGNVQDFASWQIAGATTILTTGSGNIILDSTSSTFGDLSLTTGSGTINVLENGAMNLAAVSTTGNASFTAKGNITDSGPLTIGNAVFITENNAGASITLDNAGSSFGSLSLRSRNAANLATAAGDLSVTINGSTSLGTTDTLGNLTVTATGAISNSGQIQVGGLADFKTLNNSGANITLDYSGNQLAAVRAQTRNATDTANRAGKIEIIQTGAVDVVLINTDGDLTLQTSGNLTQSGLITALGNVSLTASTMSLGTMANQLATGNSTISLYGQTVNLRTANSAIIKDSSITGDLNFVSGGAITQAGAVQVFNAANFTANGGASDITLTTGGSNYGSVRFNGANVTITEQGGMNVLASTGTNINLTSTLGGVTMAGLVSATNNLTATAAGFYEETVNPTYSGTKTINATGTLITFTGNYTFGPGPSSYSGSVKVQGLGHIYDDDRVTVVGEIVFENPGFDVIFDGLNANGTISGSHSFGAVRATSRNVSLSHLSGDTLIGLTTLTGDLNILSGGSIAHFDPITVAGNTTLATGGANFDISLAASGNNLAGIIRLTTSGNGSVSLFNQTATILGNSTVGNTLTLTTQGAITQTSGSGLQVGGNTTINASGQDITLTNVNNIFGSGTKTLGVSGGTVTLFENDNTILASPSAANNLTLRSTGQISQVNDIVVYNNAVFETWNNAGGNITLTQAGNQFGTILARTMDSTGNTAASGAIRVTESGDMIIAGALTSGAATYSSSGAMTDSAPLVIGGAASFTTTNAFSAISLTQANQIAGAITFAPNGLGTVTLRNDRDTLLAASTIQGTLSIQSLGNITQAGDLNWQGAATVQSTTGNITLTSGNNHFAALNLTGQAIILRENEATILQQVTATSLDVTSAGSITDAGTLTVSNAASFKTTNNTAQDITLSNTSSTFGSLSAQTRNAADTADVGGIITVSESGEMNLGTVRTTSNAYFTATGNITNTAGALTIGSLASFTASATNSTIAITNAANAISGVFIATTTGAGNVSLQNTVATQLGPVTAQNLIVQSTGAVTQVAALVLAGNVIINAGASNITLTTAGNNIGKLNLTGASANISMTGALDFSGLNLSGNLAATATQAVTDSGTLTVAGTVLVQTLNNTAGAASITLDEAANSFGSLTLATLNAAGAATVASDITVVENATLDLASVTTAGALNLTATAAITDSGQIQANTVTLLTLNNAGANITLDTANNLFGSITARTRNAANTANAAGQIYLVENADTDLTQLQTTGNATVITTGAITDSGAWTVGGLTTLETRNDIARAITLDNAGSSFGSLALRTLNSGANTTVGGVITVNTSGPLDFKEIRTTSAVSVTATDTITQSGNASVGGTSTFTTTANNGSILLTNANNTLQGSVQLTTHGTGRAALVNTANTTLAPASVGGNLTITSGGTITQSGALTVGGVANFTSTLANVGGVQLTNSLATDMQYSTVGGLFYLNSTGNVTQTGSLRVAGAFQQNGSGSTLLPDVGNIFGSFYASDGSVFIVQAGVVSIGPINVTGNLIVNSVNTAEQFVGVNGGTAITLNNVGNAFGGGLAVNTDSQTLTTVTSAVTGITQSGAVIVSGTASLNAGATGNITLNTDPFNSFGALRLTGFNVNVIEDSATNLSQSNISGNLTLSSVDTITNSGNLVVAGTTNLTSTLIGATINLNQTGNALSGPITFTQTGSNITLTNNIATQLAALTTTGSLQVQSNGAITQTGALNIGGTTTLATSGQAITLTNAANVFGALTVTGGGILALTENDAITQAAAWNTGATTLATSGQAITLTNAANVFGALTVTGGGILGLTENDAITQSGAWNAAATTLATSGQAITLTNVSNVLGNLAINGTPSAVTIYENDAITQAGVWSLGTASVDLRAGTQDVLLTNASNVFGAVFVQGQNATVREADVINLAGANVTNTLTLDALGGNGITQTGAVQTSILTVSSTGGITMDHAANQIAVLGNITRNGNLSIYDSAGGLDVQGTLAGTTTNQVLIRTVGNLTLSAGAQITTTGAGNQITLQADGASFINNAGATVLQTDARYRIYSYSPDAPYQAGGLTSLGYVSVNYADDPINTSNVFYFAVPTAPGYTTPNFVTPSVVTITPPTTAITLKAPESRISLTSLEHARWSAQKQPTPMIPYIWGNDLSRVTGYVLLDQDENLRRKRGLQYLFEPALMAQPTPQPAATPTRQAQSNGLGTPLAQVTWR